jgi:hypothetical protein
MSKQLKATPGPWEVVQLDHAIVVRTESPSKTQYGASRYAVIGGFDRNDHEQLAEAFANAHLIAAAPSMAEYIKKRSEEGCQEATLLWEQLNGRS